MIVVFLFQLPFFLIKISKKLTVIYSIIEAPRSKLRGAAGWRTTKSMRSQDSGSSSI
jgi:hypothetical protein